MLRSDSAPAFFLFGGDNSGVNLGDDHKDDGRNEEPEKGCFRFLLRLWHQSPDDFVHNRRYYIDFFFLVSIVNLAGWRDRGGSPPGDRRKEAAV